MKTALLTLPFAIVEGAPLPEDILGNLPPRAHLYFDLVDDEILMVSCAAMALEEALLLTPQEVEERLTTPTRAWVGVQHRPPGQFRYVRFNGDVLTEITADEAARFAPEGQHRLSLIRIALWSAASARWGNWRRLARRRKVPVEKVALVQGPLGPHAGD